VNSSHPPFRVLLSNDTLLRRIRELADRIGRDLGPEPPCLVAVIEGARTFARHLQKVLPGSPPIHEIRASSYGAGTVSSGKVTVVGGTDIPAAGRTVLLVEDIVDTGRTIAALREHFLARGARDCRVATLLTKPARRVVPVELEYVGFEIPDEFVLGFGMDLAGRYRDLPEVVIYERDVEAAHSPG
jgi:hypoxanthine phosphoribosyltransferase